MIMLLSSSPPRLRTTTKVFLRSSWPAARTVPLLLMKPTRATFFNDAHLDGDLTDDYVDYLTFFIDPELRPAEGETASLSLVMNVA